MIATDRTLALVTGATQGIGEAVTKILASKHSYHVILGVRNIDRGKAIASEIIAKGHEASVVEVDLADQASVENAVTTIERTYGYLDVLINNAGISIDRDGYRTWELYTRTFTTNIIGTATLTEGLLPLLRKAKNGPPRVVFVSTIMGSLQTSLDKTTGWYHIDYTAYDASKAALNMLTINYDRKLANVEAKVNSVCPGYIKTGLTNHNERGESPEVGAVPIIKMATLGANGPSATFTNRNGKLPW